MGVRSCLGCFELALARFELESLDAWFAEFSRPSDVDSQLDAELGSYYHDPRRSGGLVVTEAFSLALGPTLSYLRERNLEACISGFWVFPLNELVNFGSLDEYGNVVSSVAAGIGDDERGRILFPLDSPIDMSWVRLLGSLPSDDLIRFLTECVRVFGNLVRFVSLGESTRSELICSLGIIVGVLRSTVGDASGDDRCSTNNERGCGSDVCADDLRFHDSDSMAVVPSE